MELSAEEEAALRGFCCSRSLPHALVARAKLVLWSAEGKSNTEIAEKLNWTKATVGKWRQRFIERRLSGLYDELRPGRPRSVSDEKVALLLRRTLKNKPPAGSHWSVRQAAGSNGLSKSTVHRVFRAFAVQPHRSKSFKLSSDPFFVEKVRDVVGLYLNPPNNAIVLSVNEKSQIQALDRTQPVLPMGLGYVEGVTHDFVRHGIATLFAAFDIASGTVLMECKPRHRHQEFLQFLKRFDQAVPGHLNVHLIVDNYATHKHARVRLWLAERTRFHIHSTPNLFVVAEPDRALVRSHHPAGNPPWHLPKRQRHRHQNRPLRPTLQPQLPPLHMDRHSRVHLPETRPPFSRISGTAH